MLRLDTFDVTLPNGIEYTCVLNGNGGQCSSLGCEAESVTLDLPHGTLDERCAPCLARIWGDAQDAVEAWKRG